MKQTITLQPLSNHFRIYCPNQYILTSIHQKHNDSLIHTTKLHTMCSFINITIKCALFTLIQNYLIRNVSFNNSQNSYFYNNNHMKETRKNIGFPSCEICHKGFDSYYHIPRILPKCGHTFCQKCIINKIYSKSNRKIFTCPLCKSESTIRKSIDQQFLKNLTIINLANDYKKQNFSHLHSAETLCQQHHKFLQFKCQTCQGIRICSYCALFGKHKAHNFCQSGQANSNDLKQLQTKFKILTSSIQQIILPSSENNIINKFKADTTLGLQKVVKLHFRQYYQQILKKQTQILNQCSELQVSENIYHAVDKILEGYDLVKTQYINSCQNYLCFQVDQLVIQIRKIHQEIQAISKIVDQQASEYIDNLAKILNNTSIFQCKQFSLNLKQINETQKCKSPLKEIQVQSPQNKQIIKQKELKLQIKKRESMNLVSKALISARSFHSNSKSQIQIHQNKIRVMNKSIESKFNINESPNKSQIINKSNLNNKTNSQIQYSTNLQTKQQRKSITLNYQMKLKFQQICKQIDRQQSLGTLQLIGLQINDNLLINILQQMRMRRLKFSMIKLVKNNITDNGLKGILQFLKKDAYTKVLNLTGNCLSSNALMIIIQAANKNKILKTIYLTNNKITSFQLKSKKSQLQKLDIQIIL